ncbi:MAG: tetratricopeptide repeat protein [Acidimicrobiia bacterium]|nr:tetratricopeptide repeat protein [Acidimicrobiia bacterium]
MTLLLLLLLAQSDFTALYEQAYRERAQSIGPNHPKTLSSARDLALYLAQRGEFRQATSYLQQVLNAPPTREAPAATALHNWAAAIEQDSPDAAERLYRLALQIRAKILPPLDAELATTRLNLAGLLLGTSPEPESLARLALAAFEKSLGASHPRTGAACGTLAAALAMKGDVPAAENLFRRALTIAEKAHGPDSPETAAALENLADLLSQTGREAAARPLRARAESITRRQR